jgi:hypothetical protein
MLRAVLLSLLLSTGCAEGAPDPVTPPPPPPPPPGQTTILMLGNSLTDTWDVAGMVADFAADGGAVRPRVVAMTRANWSLEDHAASTLSTAAIASGDFDVVVLQQGPTTLPDSRVNLATWAAVLRDLIVPTGARAGLFVAWPPLGGAIDDGITNHTAVATQLGMALYPVAQAFREARRLDATLPLYGTDGFHQTATGSALAGMVIAATIFGQDPTEYANPLPLMITAADMAVLRQAAGTAVDSYARP